MGRELTTAEEGRDKAEDEHEAKEKDFNRLKGEHTTAFEEHKRLQGLYDAATEEVQPAYTTALATLEDELKVYNNKKRAELRAEHFGGVDEKHKGW